MPTESSNGGRSYYEAARPPPDRRGRIRPRRNLGHISDGSFGSRRNAFPRGAGSAFQASTTLPTCRRRARATRARSARHFPSPLCHLLQAAFRRRRDRPRHSWRTRRGSNRGAWRPYVTGSCALIPPSTPAAYSPPFSHPSPQVSRSGVGCGRHRRSRFSPADDGGRGKSRQLQIGNRHVAIPGGIGGAGDHHQPDKPEALLQRGRADHQSRASLFRQAVGVRKRHDDDVEGCVVHVRGRDRLFRRPRPPIRRKSRTDRRPPPSAPSRSPRACRRTRSARDRRASAPAFRAPPWG